MHRSLILALSLTLISFPAYAKKGETIPGPISATVEKVVDGDTLAVNAHIWVGQNIRVLVRLDGVDTPELSGRCMIERTKARAARKFVAKKIAGRKVTLSNVRRGKYAGRVVAKISLSTGEDLGGALLKTGHGVPYKNRRAAKWCCTGAKCEQDATRLSKIKKYFKF